MRKKITPNQKKAILKKIDAGIKAGASKKAMTKKFSITAAQEWVWRRNFTSELGGSPQKNVEITSLPTRRKKKTIKSATNPTQMVAIFGTPSDIAMAVREMRGQL